MPQRFAQGTKRLIALSSLGSLGLAYLSLAPEILGLIPVLNILNAFLLALTLGGLWLLLKDIEGMDTSGSTDTSQDMSSSTSEKPETDGGIRLSPQLRELQQEAPEGGGALAGLVAGGSLGILGGPVGVVIGGIAGGLLGNEAEYQQIVNKYRDALAETAKNALRQERHVHAPPPYTTENISHRSSDDTYLVTLSDISGNEHSIRLNLDSQSYTYEDPE